MDELLEHYLTRICVVVVEVQPNDWTGRLQKWWYTDLEFNGIDSGFLISPSGHLITNKHVVEDALNISILLTSPNRLVKASVLALHPTENIALLKIDDAQNLPFSHLEISSEIGEVGDWAFSPRLRGTCPYSNDNFFITPTIGKILSNTSPTPFSLLSFGYSFGNSGTPVLNLQGGVIGVLTCPAILEGSTQPDVGCSLMIPSYKFKDWLEQVLRP